MKKNESVLMEPSKRCVGNEQQCATKFLGMNDDCILAITEFLILDDLYSMGSTCVRINELAGDHFKRNFPNESIDIHYKRNKVIVFKYPNENAQKYFGKYFRSIRVNGGPIIGWAEVFQFIESKCCSELKHLELNHLYGKIGKKHGAMIKAQLANLESIKINELRIIGDIHAGILQYCKDVKRLSIHTDRDANADWLIQSYQNLEHLDIYFKDARHRSKFNQFFEQFSAKNPKLRVIECSQYDVVRSVFSSQMEKPYLKLQFKKADDMFKFKIDLHATTEQLVE